MTDPPLTDLDLDALTRAITIDRAESADHTRQIDALLKSEPCKTLASSAPIAVRSVR